MSAPEKIPDDAIVGPCKLDCEEKCDIPAGLVLTPIVRPRHAWGDIMACPHCERAFLVWRRPAQVDLQKSESE